MIHNVSSKSDSYEIDFDWYWFSAEKSLNYFSKYFSISNMKL